MAIAGTGAAIEVPPESCVTLNPLAHLYRGRGGYKSTIRVAGGSIRLELRQNRKLITVPKITIGATVTTIMNGDNGFGEISSIAIPDSIQSTEKHTAKSILGTPSQYSRADIAVAGAMAAPIM
jgi:hypothetical protein